ncbi:site-specific integrase [Photobacterium damselae]|uniref:site-specific integrase n=1 Tax=Photobacterium damselae TaxID=38293 RepID=UPI0010FD64B6|nr:site-specific integrase [Photobacterium damselae]TLS80657.1 site-specific integrase [Photobacterium damselae subsp. damselae]
MANKGQLYNIIDSEFELWSAYSTERKNNLITKDASGIPFIRYPDGIPCTEANIYMLGCFNRSLSRKVGGGTLKTYASNISHLIRFCHKNGWAFTTLSDDRFELFIRGLQAEIDKFGNRERGVNQVIKIGRACIEFITTVADFHAHETLIGEEDFNAIKIEKKEVKRFVEGMKKPKIEFYYHHSSFPKPDSENKRLPISHIAAAAIKAQINKQENSDIRQRDIMIYQTLEQTGARRTEVMLLHVNDVKAALIKTKESKSDTVGLQFTTLKRRADHTRIVPVPVTYLQNLKDYITKVRRKVIKRTIGMKNDHGFVFVSVGEKHAQEGKALGSNTLSTYFNRYKHAAGIKEGAYAHLIRHAYLTERMKDVILEHKFNNKDEFRRALFNTEQFKMQLQQWSGHTQLASLNTYINLAFADLAGVRKTYNAVALKSSVNVVKEALSAIKTDLKGKRMTATEIIEKMSSLIDAFEMDIDRAIKIDEESKEEQGTHA